jgi:hypothetical protein
MPTYIPESIWPQRIGSVSKAVTQCDKMSLGCGKNYRLKAVSISL